MAKTLWNIDFSTLNVTNERVNGWGTKYTHSDNITDGVYTADGQGATPSFGINAVDIDWDGATWSSITGALPTTINTTGDLLKAIKYAAVQQKPITESAGIHGTFCTKQRLEHSKWRSA